MSPPELAAVMRPGRFEDVPALFDVLRGEIALGRQDVIPNEKRVARTLARFDWESKSRVVLRDGELVGGVFVVSRASPEGPIATVYACGETAVYRELVGWGVRFARATGAAAVQVFLGRGRRDDLAGLELTPVRPWWRMDRSLAGPLPDVTPVGGYELADARTVPAGTWAETFNRTFADHWRFAPRVEDEIVGDKQARLCLMVLTSDAHAPVALTLGEVEEYPGDARAQPVGLISSVGTVPEHRRRGLARWLVTETVVRLRDAGARCASLYVDGDNAMRPSEMYRNLGFEVAFEAEVWEANRP